MFSWQLKVHSCYNVYCIAKFIYKQFWNYLIRFMSAYILIAEECLAVWDLGQIIINIDFIACVSKIFRYYNFTITVGDGQGGLACCDSWGCKESDMTERLNWTDLKEWGQDLNTRFISKLLTYTIDTMYERDD